MQTIADKLKAVHAPGPCNEWLRKAIEAAFCYQDATKKEIEPGMETKTKTCGTCGGEGDCPDCGSAVQQ